MTAKNRSTLKNDLENGDTFDQTIAGDLVDSAVNLADTTAQEMSSNLKLPSLHASTEVSAPIVIASAGQINGTVSASAMYANSLFVAGGEVQAGGGGPVGQLVITATAETSIGSAGTYEYPAGTIAVRLPTVDFSALSTPELKYKGNVARNFRVTCALSMDAAANSKLTAVAPTINGVAQTDFEIERFISTGANEGAVMISAFLSANVSATIGVKISNKTDATNLTAGRLVLTVSQV